MARLTAKEVENVGELMKALVAITASTTSANKKDAIGKYVGCKNQLPEQTKGHGNQCSSGETRFSSLSEDVLPTVSGKKVEYMDTESWRLGDLMTEG